MRKHITRAALAASLVALGACAQFAPDFNRPAGASIDEGAFGDPTRLNMQAMMGRGEALGHLGGRFAAAVPTTINFPFGSAALTAEARAALDAQAAFMRQFPELRFSVFGHTDLVGSQAANEALGRRRAEAAVAYLASRGISTSRLEALVSFGERRPLVPTQGPERANRRTVTEVGGFVPGQGLELDGKYARIAYRAYVASAQ
jgi:outer membrane protein OmpA-like peptidoglycan-associated protein